MTIEDIQKKEVYLSTDDSCAQWSITDKDGNKINKESVISLKVSDVQDLIDRINDLEWRIEDLCYLG